MDFMKVECVMEETNLDKKIVLIVMDGVGLSPEEKSAGDAYKAAHTPFLDKLRAERPWMPIRAHGKAVGLPTDNDMGNSEVGHNALGAGQIYSQGAELVNESIESGEIYDSETWHDLVDFAKDGDGALHLIGLLSDGNVHSNINHLKSLIDEAKKEGIHRVFVHALLDGRDVPPTSGGKYIQEMEDFFKGMNDENFTACFASGGGRMYITMDRYKADWEMVERGWNAHVHGQSDNRYESAGQAYQALRDATGKIDQDLPEFVIVKDGKPVGPIEDGDSVIFFNFRGDRALEISMAFDDDDFPYFDRGRRPDVFYAGMLEYDGDLHIPDHYLVNPPSIHNTLTEFLVDKGIKEYACSETQKFGHMTYFWNGNQSEKISEELETWEEIPSDRVSFDQRPWMKSAEIADALMKAIETDEYGFLRINFANGDMVGHTGVFDSVRIAMEAVDLAISRILPVAQKHGYTVIITADHGNADDMIQVDKETGKEFAKTSHSLNPVPFILVDDDPKLGLQKDKANKVGLANVAGTVVDLMGFDVPEIWEDSFLDRK